MIGFGAELGGSGAPALESGYLVTVAEAQAMGLLMLVASIGVVLLSVVLFSLALDYWRGRM